MLLNYLEAIALKSLEGKGISYVIDSQLVLRYSLYVFLLHFVLYVLIKRKNFSARNYFPKFFFAFYFVILVCFTILPIDFPGINEPGVNLNLSLAPLLNIFTNRYNLINFSGNIILFSPLVILGYVSKFKIFNKLWTTICFALAVSIFIEFIQYFESIHGYTELAVVDIIDILTNTIGAVIGWILIKLYSKREVHA